jgi:hypothetical protein
LPGQARRIDVEFECSRRDVRKRELPIVSDDLPVRSLIFANQGYLGSGDWRSRLIENCSADATRVLLIGLLPGLLIRLRRGNRCRYALHCASRTRLRLFSLGPRERWNAAKQNANAEPD